MNGTPGVEHIIHKQHLFALDGKIHLGGTGSQRFVPPPEIIAVKCDVKLAVFKGPASGHLIQKDAEPVCKVDTAVLDAYDAEVCGIFVVFEDLMAQPLQRKLKSQG